MDKYNHGTAPFPEAAEPDTLTAMQSRALPIGGLLLVVLSGCRTPGPLVEVGNERPPTPLDSMDVASDARIDSLGHIAGSFVGEGTSRTVHLLSTDSGFIAQLARSFRPDLPRDAGLWGELAHRKVVALERPAGSTAWQEGGPASQRTLVGSPLGHTEVTLRVGLLRGSDCGWRGAQAELLVEGELASDDPPLQGPVLGSFVTGGSHSQPERIRGLVRRPPPPEPSDSLVRELIDRTELYLDSSLSAEYEWVALRPLHDSRIEINTLADVDAADVIPFRAGDDRIRYAVSLRVRRVTGGLDTLVATGVMVWDSAGAWRQEIFRPTLLRLVQGYPAPYDALRRALFWRRLQPISDFAYPRDDLWMEQVNVRNGTVLWGIVQPRENVVVAAAEVSGPCR
jgi:hypothetical protein